MLIYVGISASTNGKELTFEEDLELSKLERDLRDEARMLGVPDPFPHLNDLD